MASGERRNTACRDVTYSQDRALITCTLNGEGLLGINMYVCRVAFPYDHQILIVAHGSHGAWRNISLLSQLHIYCEREDVATTSLEINSRKQHAHYHLVFPHFIPEYRGSQFAPASAFARCRIIPKDPAILSCA